MSKPYIHCLTPVCPKDEGSIETGGIGHDISHAYDLAMAHVWDDEWVIIRDPDTQELTSENGVLWYRAIERAVELKPEAGLFLARTNNLERPLSQWQMTNVEDQWNPDITYHIRRALEEANRFWKKSPTSDIEMADVTDITLDPRGHIGPYEWKEMSGFFFAISKKTWNEIGGAPKTVFCDWAIHEKVRSIGKRIWLVMPIYIFHCRHFMEHFGIQKI